MAINTECVCVCVYVYVNSAMAAWGSWQTRSHDAINDFEATHVGAMQAKRQTRKSMTIRNTGQWACDHCDCVCDSRIGFYAHSKANQRLTPWCQKEMSQLHVASSTAHTMWIQWWVGTGVFPTWGIETSSDSSFIRWHSHLTITSARSTANLRCSTVACHRQLIDMQQSVMSDIQGDVSREDATRGRQHFIFFTSMAITVQ